ncbi:MAG: hypothetical protein KDD38_10605, partial [Bdellovibrionales bacterium]|nr:hypothetical protein [Bdellovibrionales bacterium]
MSEAIELVIRDLLLAEGNSDRVAKSLVKRLKSAAPNRKERIGFVHFLIQCGYYREVLELYLEWLKEVLSMPLYPFYFLLHQSGFRPGEEFIRQIFNGQDSAQPENKISSYIKWEAHDSRFIELKQVHVSKLQKKQKQRKSRHFEKLEYLRDNRMLGEEEKFLDELIYLYP